MREQPERKPAARALRKATDWRGMVWNERKDGEMVFSGDGAFGERDVECQLQLQLHEQAGDLIPRQRMAGNGRKVSVVSIGKKISTCTCLVDEHGEVDTAFPRDEGRRGETGNEETDTRHGVTTWGLPPQRRRRAAAGFDGPRPTPITLPPSSPPSSDHRALGSNGGPMSLSPTRGKWWNPGKQGEETFSGAAGAAGASSASMSLRIKGLAQMEASWRILPTMHGGLGILGRRTRQPTYRNGCQRIEQYESRSFPKDAADPLFAANETGSTYWILSYWIVLSRQLGRPTSWGTEGNLAGRNSFLLSSLGFFAARTQHSLVEATRHSPEARCEYGYLVIPDFPNLVSLGTSLVALGIRHWRNISILMRGLDPHSDSLPALESDSAPVPASASHKTNNAHLLCASKALADSTIAPREVIYTTFYSDPSKTPSKALGFLGLHFPLSYRWAGATFDPKDGTVEEGQTLRDSYMRNCNVHRNKDSPASHETSPSVLLAVAATRKGNLFSRKKLSCTPYVAASIDERDPCLKIIRCTGNAQINFGSDARQSMFATLRFSGNEPYICRFRGGRGGNTGGCREDDGIPAFGTHTKSEITTSIAENNENKLEQYRKSAWEHDKPIYSPHEDNHTLPWLPRSRNDVAVGIPEACKVRVPWAEMIFLVRRLDTEADHTSQTSTLFWQPVELPTMQCNPTVIPHNMLNPTSTLTQFEMTTS
ncbi:hypothetical protein SODALDRAFT_362096 [Sodiomyces alkalinus F11]|uniref:Uncharacterized protein n=1 Tax=Sodiomyces alkalinus (strain CBS 110278 / VKM F-3762 / F11) TaxID=1314773 RepID=A0A3N2PP70_SODAK|nr:hypothetical protein SODALDRAFT_362096 [Sodiomyces alkalinus F11]ROT36305.1 hypothetical protein SODALDRAFT_362096 [Sodiomyces alkalinus F11]